MGSGYLVPPEGSGRRGVLVLHSWWGLDAVTRARCDALADAGFAVLAPDLLDGAAPADVDEARRVLGERSPDEMAGLVLRSVSVLRAVTGRPDDPVGVVGHGMGASLALWVAARRPSDIGAVVGYYGSQAIDFDDVTAPVLLHFGRHDVEVGEDERVTTEAFLRLGGVEVEVRLHDAGHDFAEPGRPGHAPAAAEAADDDTLAFLRHHLAP